MYTVQGPVHKIKLIIMSLNFSSNQSAQISLAPSSFLFSLSLFVNRALNVDLYITRQSRVYIIKKSRRVPGTLGSQHVLK